MENRLARLAGHESPLVFLGVPDRQVATFEEQVDRSLTDLVGDGSRTVLAAPWTRTTVRTMPPQRAQPRRRPSASGAGLVPYSAARHAARLPLLSPARDRNR